jgi:hypothetical protein
MIFKYVDRKIVAVIDEDLPVGKAMNALGHMAFALGHYVDDSWMGQHVLHDFEGKTHMGLARHAFIVLKATKEEIKAIHDKGPKDGLDIVDYVQEMFDTDTDEKLVTAIRAKKPEEMVYHGIALAGTSAIIGKLTGHLKLYK